MLDSTKLNQVIKPANLSFSANQPIKRHSLTFGHLNNDTIQFNNVKPTIAFMQRGKESCVVSFTGLKNPLEAQSNNPPALQMKVRGVMAHQKIEGAKFPAKDNNVGELADSKWKDGQKLDFDIVEDYKGNKQIKLSVPGFGEVGRVHDEISEIILPSIERNPQAYKFELSNVIAGTTKGAETIGLRVNLVYTGKNPGEEAHVREAFNAVLNNPECADKVLLYQPKTSPEEVLKLILDHETKLNGPQAAQEMETIINNIVKEIKDPSNKRILLVGHCKPDGDTIGCVLGLKNAIGLMDPNKVVDCAVDDKIPGLFRHKMPGIDGEMKVPHNPERLQKIKDELAKLKQQPPSQNIKDQIDLLTDEVEFMQNPENLLDKNAKYDMIITMDIPTPKRFTDKFKGYFDQAKKIIYIDHHPHRIDEWRQATKETGLDIDKVHNNQLAWIADAVPAATQLVGIIANRLIPQLKDIGDGTKKASEVFKTQDQIDKLRAYVASLVTGASTDTGSFTRTANLLPENIKNPVTGETVPVQNRPNFLPEGMSKWLLDLTDGAIDKKWLREEITWEVSDEKGKGLDESAYEIMLKHAISGKTIYEDLSLGFIEASYDNMNQIWQAQLDVEPDTTLLDIQNAFKYSETMGVLRSDPEISGRQGGNGPGGRGEAKDEPKSLRDKKVRSNPGDHGGKD